MRKRGVDDGLAALLRNRMRAQADLFQALTSHPTLIGSGRESALTELLRHVVPRRFELLSGTIAKIEDGKPTKATHQLDLIVADTTDYPTLLRVGDTAVVLSPSVRGVVEIKSDLRRGVSFIAAMAQIARAKSLLGPTDPVFTALFSFGSPTNHSSLRKWLTDLAEVRTALADGSGTQAIQKLRDALLAERGLMGTSDAKELHAILSPWNLPDLILSDRGVLAQKVRITKPAPGDPRVMFGGPTSYVFVRDREHLPTIVTLLDRLVAQLSTHADHSVQQAFAIVRMNLGLQLEGVSGVSPVQIP